MARKPIFNNPADHKSPPPPPPNRPDFDSPSIFCRLLDKSKGGHFSISPPQDLPCTTKQSYLPSSNILQTRYIHEDGVVDLVDFFPRPRTSFAPVQRGGSRPSAFREVEAVQEELKRWLVRRVECIRGRLSLDIEIFPALGYARERHETTVLRPVNETGAPSKAVTFHSAEPGGARLQLDVTIDKDDEAAGSSCPVVEFTKVAREGMLSEGVVAHITLQEGQAVSFTLRDDHESHVTGTITTQDLDKQQHDTQTYWYNWISKCKYKGRWREVVTRSLMILKMLTYEPTGAIVAAPTFSVPEEISGPRNWDYRYSWVRDSSFTIYILLRLGYIEEADKYMEFISERMLKSRGPDGGLPIMFTIRGDTEIPEIELDHLEGYRGSRPVRIGNGAAFHKQFDIYGELMDAIYLNNKYGKPVTWDTWVSVRHLLGTSQSHGDLSFIPNSLCCLGNIGG